VSIRAFLGIPDQHALTGDTETVRKVIEALDQLDPARARFIAAFGYILGRVAYADMKISPEEVHAMERIIMDRGTGLDRGPDRQDPRTALWRHREFPCDPRVQPDRHA
jgi:hypothetical protein